MSKAANIYWGDPPKRSRIRRTTAQETRKARGRAARRSAPWWLSFLIVTSIFVMLCVSLNLRAYSEAREEAGRHEHLAGQIQSLRDENLALQDEIHALKTDPTIIQREARKIGVDLRGGNVPVPTK